MGAIREQFYYSIGHQEVVTSIHFVKIKIKKLAELIGFELRPVGPSQLWNEQYNHTATEAHMPIV